MIGRGHCGGGLGLASEGDLPAFRGDPVKALLLRACPIETELILRSNGQTSDGLRKSPVLESRI